MDAILYTLYLQKETADSAVSSPLFSVKFLSQLRSAFRHGIPDGMMIFDQLPHVGRADTGDGRLGGQHHRFQTGIKALHNSGKGVFVIEIGCAPHTAHDVVNTPFCRIGRGQPLAKLRFYVGDPLSRKIGAGGVRKALRYLSYFAAAASFIVIQYFFAISLKASTSLYSTSYAYAVLLIGIFLIFIVF